MLRKLAGGMTSEELRQAYPKLTQEDVSAAIEYAADAIAHEEVIVSQGTLAGAKG